LRFGVAIRGVFAKRDIKMTTSAQTMYSTRFLAHSANGNVFSGDWAVTPAAPNGLPEPGNAPAGLVHYMRVASAAQIAAHVGGLLANADGDYAVGHTTQEAINLVRTGALPATWSAHENNAAGAAVAVTDALLPAILAGSNVNENIGVIDSAQYNIKAEHTANMDLNMFGIRGVFELGYDLSEDLMLFINAGYMYQFENKDAKNKKALNYEVKDDVETAFTAADGNTTFKKKGLKALPFAWNNGHLTSGLKAKASVKETCSILGGFTWKPSNHIGLSAFAGARRYEMAVTWEGGSWAYPGNPNLYVEAFRTESNVSKFLIKNEKKHELTATKWALVFGGDFMFVINENHNVTLGISYSTFDAVLHGKNNSSADSKNYDSTDDAEGDAFFQVELDNPIGSVNTSANMAVPTGWHMLDATNVSTKLTGALEVTDLSFTLGYKLTL